MMTLENSLPNSGKLNSSLKYSIQKVISRYPRFVTTDTAKTWMREAAELLDQWVRGKERSVFETQANNLIECLVHDKEFDGLILAEDKKYKNERRLHRKAAEEEGIETLPSRQELFPFRDDILTPNAWYYSLPPNYHNWSSYEASRGFEEHPLNRDPVYGAIAETARRHPEFKGLAERCLKSQQPAWSFLAWFYLAWHDSPDNSILHINNPQPEGFGSLLRYADRKTKRSPSLLADLKHKTKRFRSLLGYRTGEIRDAIEKVTFNRDGCYQSNLILLAINDGIDNGGGRFGDR